MPRRSTPQRRIDDIAFPVRVKVVVPPNGFGRRFDDMHAWLDRTVGRGDYAHHATEAMGAQATAFYFRDPATAAAFVDAFGLELADGTNACTYQSPTFPFGRQ